VPVREMMEHLARRGYAGAIAVDWEKMWHPEIDGPEVALPQYARVLREYITGLKAASEAGYAPTGI
jgi:hypothetical protein